MGQLTTENMRARIERLEALSRGLAKEVALWKERPGSMPPVHRKAYLAALQDAIAGLDAGRVTLEAAVARIEQSQPTDVAHQIRFF